MKLYQLLKLFDGRDQNDDILIPCGEGEYTGSFAVMPAASDVVSNPRHLMFVPLEGALAKKPGMEFRVTPKEKQK